MMTNEQEARTRFLMLLQQLELTDDIYMSLFEEGELTRLSVHKKIAYGTSSLSCKTYCHIKYTSYLLHV